MGLRTAKIHDVHVRTPSEITTEALHRIGELYGIEASIRGKSAAGRLDIRHEKAIPQPNALEGWLRKKQKMLSQHLDSVAGNAAHDPAPADESRILCVCKRLRELFAVQ
ncbi:TPA: hypothetical protein MIM79_02870 [Klebsiella variicola]|nr:hypothetical protein [Klebsiella variicola]